MLFVGTICRIEGNRSKQRMFALKRPCAQTIESESNNAAPLTLLFGFSKSALKDLIGTDTHVARTGLHSATSARRYLRPWTKDKEK